MNVKKILLVLVAFCATNLFAQPATNPETPPVRQANQVISIYSAAYTTVSPAPNYNPNWGQSGFASATTFTLSGNEMRHYPNMNYQGIVIGSDQNISSLDTFHLDIWTTNCSSLDIFLVTASNGERKINRTLTLNAWNKIKIPLSEYAALGIPLTAVKELKFESVVPAWNGGPGTANIYVDNIYFYTQSVLPTISNFSVPAKTLADAPFAITPPTSNSSGAFSYISSNTNVATISGNMITIVGGGSSTITATQAAAGGFGSGSITANFVVTVAPISTNAPNPTKPAARVISLFSDIYTNVPVTTFRTSWSNASSALVDTSINGNNIKKYTGVDFVGIEFPPIDATLADSVHISMWTPSAATFSLKLVNNSPNVENIVGFRVNAGSHTYGPKPPQGQWNVYSIPLSLFATANGGLNLSSRNSIFQMLIVGDAPFENNVYYIDNIYFSSTNNVLPVDFTNFEATKAGNAAQLSWNVANEVNVLEYVVEKSTDGASYKNIGAVAAKGATKYAYTDNNLGNGVLYYRIKAVDKDGSFKYSATKGISNNSNGVEFSIYPNPAKNELVIKNLIGTNTISLVDASGKIVLNRAGVTNATTTINITTVSKGFYTVVVNNGAESKTSKIIIEK